MHDIKAIRCDATGFDAALARRGAPGASVGLLAMDDARRAAIAAAEAARERRNALAREFGIAKARKDDAALARLNDEGTTLKEASPALDAAVAAATAALDGALMALPNLPMADVPDGIDETGNVELRRVGEPRAFPEGFRPREHHEIGERLDLMDFEVAAAMSGSRFVLLTGQFARLHRALGQYMLDMHVDRHGCVEVDPPLLVRDVAMLGTAQLPKFRDDQFPAGDGHWLIPTAEVPLTNMAARTIVDEVLLPWRLAALTPCFRLEAGAAGRDTRGMIRQHQFSKVEMVSITRPEDSEAEHLRMTDCAESVLKGLGLPYRVMLLCAGDMGFAARRTHDIEVWLPGQGAYREISSVSTCGDFQARRMGARLRPTKGGAPRFVHTLNGSGVAVGRALVAVLENYQEPDGTVTVPDVLRGYMGGLARIGDQGPSTS